MIAPALRSCTPIGILKRCPRLVAHLALLMWCKEDAAAAIVSEAAAERATRNTAVRRTRLPFATRMVWYAVRFREYHRDMREVSLALRLERVLETTRKAAAGEIPITSSLLRR